MNTRGTQWDNPITPRDTNLAGGRGRGSNPALRRRKFIDDLVARDNSSTEARNQGPSSVKRSLVTPRLEASVSTVEKTIGSATVSGVPEEGIPRDKGSSMGASGSEVVYHIDGKEVTKEEWLQL